MRLQIGFLVTLCSLLAAASSLRADEPEPALKKTFDKMLAAIVASDKDAFAADGTQAVKDGTTQEAIDGINKVVGPRLKAGYEAKYLCELKQVGHEIHLWKLTFKDGGDDLVVRIARKHGKIAGFFLQ